MKKRKIADTSFKNQKSGEKISIYVWFLRHFILNKIETHFFMSKDSLNITHDRKGVSKFPYMVFSYKDLQLIDKLLITESGAPQSSS